ncbi:Mss4-like protein [Tricladium varicosporioides]|nr:Mss4-like protein [Hymenoscyphus varicosporioides]
MPLTNESLTLTGGCDCTSIAYTISIPPLDSRPTLEESIKPPKIYFDHCNKCRTVSGALVQAWINIPQTWVTFSLSSTKDGDRVKLTVEDVLKEHTATSGIMSHYKSSADVSRYFCGKCGTNLVYVYTGKRSGDDGGEAKIEMIDIVLGSLSKESLEVEGVKPDRHFYWESGIEWVKGGLVGGEMGALPKHPDGCRKIVV